MDIQITFAERPDELDALFAARYRVVVEDDRQYPANPERRIADRFDRCPAARNVVALDGGEVIGGVRFTEATTAGLPIDGWLAVEEYLPTGTGRYGDGGSFFLDRRYRKQARIAGDILTLGYAWALSRGWTHLIAALNPDILGTFLRHGYRQLAPIQYHAGKGLPFVPVLLDFATFDPATRDLCARIPALPTASPSGNRFVWDAAPALALA